MNDYLIGRVLIKIVPKSAEATGKVCLHRPDHTALQSNQEGRVVTKGICSFSYDRRTD